MTTVDAVNGTDTLVREEISVKQVAVADRLVLTKADLAGPMQQALIRRLSALNATNMNTDSPLSNSPRVPM